MENIEVIQEICVEVSASRRSISESSRIYGSKAGLEHDDFKVP